MRRPSLRFEKSLLRDGRHFVAGVDEVGRGALCGPVSVGVVVIDCEVGRVPDGLADSKLLSPEQRESVLPKVQRWAPHHAVGHADAAEVDAFGILVALRLAALRALAGLARHGAPTPDVVVLDGSHDWLSDRPEQGDLFAPDPGLPDVAVPAVLTKVKADLSCASVAAASVLAKTERDRLMSALARDHPAYGWDSNKGYAAPQHVEALRELGPTPWHRRSWRLPGVIDSPPTATDVAGPVSTADAVGEVPGIDVRGGRVVAGPDPASGGGLV
jgi:ribonuclease HII